MAEPEPTKPIHSLILDAGPLINNAVSISTIINSAEQIWTTPAIISEIRDEATRSRLETTLRPFLRIKNPSPASYDAVVAFSKKTGDHAVLSRQDLGILALAYEVHCERNGGPWGLREAPKQPVKTRLGEEEKINEQKAKKGEKPKAMALEQVIEQNQVVQQQDILVTDTTNQPSEFTGTEKETIEQAATQDAAVEEEAHTNIRPVLESEVAEQHITQGDENATTQENQPLSEGTDTTEEPHEPTGKQQNTTDTDVTHPILYDVAIAGDVVAPQDIHQKETEEQISSENVNEVSQAALNTEDLSQDIASLNISTPPSPPASSDSDSDSDGDWITPSNLNARQAADSGLTSNSRTSAPVQLDVATMTIDFAMQNVLLQMNLHLLSTNMQRIKHLTSKVLRCHACFLVLKQLDKQFCPRCGGASLRRVSCSTNAKGEFKIHLAKNFQWNKRGDRYSVPKPIAGTANGKWSGQGGGQGGWGRDLILAEDQKEYQKQIETEKRKKGARDLMDDDYLPGILTGDRSGRAGGRMKVGAGKNVNSKKKR
ncbi:Nin one binding Zn-ribbon like-domain-containing protein [Phaeosphaeriaceae sp. PMI808]|nr:Nin one binding Zn-ribbon like-domain-containing protein [Phaeosphaeriaceae sp. PMI808]